MIYPQFVNNCYKPLLNQYNKPNTKPTTNQINGSPVVVFGFGPGVSVGGGGAGICFVRFAQ
jgi:hypothetical protein